MRTQEILPWDWLATKSLRRQECTKDLEFFLLFNMRFYRNKGNLLFLAILFLLMLSWKSNQATDPFSNLNYDKVVAYDFNGEHEMQLVYNGKIFAEVYKKTILSSEQINYIDNVLADTSTYGAQTAACF